VPYYLVRRHLFVVLTWTVVLATSGIALDKHTPRPILDPASVPSWFQTGRFRAARWDGGPIEAEKGRLSGWPNYTADDPDGVLRATRDWYNPKTVEFLQIAHINWAWVTWSNGFSPATEKEQWALLARYIAACHKSNIRVAAYISSANIFWKDMFKELPASIAWVERDFHGGPVYYTRPNRYMADIANPEWLELQKARIEAAARAGADAVWIDNTFSNHGEEKVTRLIDALYAAASRINPHFVIMSNYNRGIYTWGRLQNGVTTEDGGEPGYYEDRSQGSPLVVNAGLLRYNYAIGEGWRPVSAEFGGRHAGDRMTTPMQPRKWQLSIAECAMYHVSLEPFFEGLFLRDLYSHEPGALEGLRAIGTYNSFLERHEQYYVQPQSVARAAILSDTTDTVVPYLNELSKHHLNYDVLFNYQAPREPVLNRYKVIVLPNTNPLSKDWCAALEKWVRENSGTVIAIQDASLFSPEAALPDQDFGLGPLLGISRRSLPESMQVTPRGKGHAIYLPGLPPPSELASLVRPYLENSELVEVEERDAVLSNAAYQAAPRRIVLHLLNYRQDRQQGLHVRVKRPVRTVEIFSPDNLGNAQPVIHERSGYYEILVPELQTYDLVAIYLRGDAYSNDGW